MPSPTRFVVKNGSKIRAIAACSMPVPVSRETDLEHSDVLAAALLAASCDRQLAAVRHRLDGVVDDIQEDLLHLIGVDGDLRQAVVEARSRSPTAPRSAWCLTRNSVCSISLFTETGAAVEVVALMCEIQQVADDVAGAQGFAFDHRELLAPWPRHQGLPRFHQQGAAQDAGQRIVDLVSDARGQLADGRQFGGAEQLALQLLLFVDPVLQHRHHVVEGLAQVRDLVRAGGLEDLASFAAAELLGEHSLDLAAAMGAGHLPAAQVAVGAVGRAHCVYWQSLSSQQGTRLGF